MCRVGLTSAGVMICSGAVGGEGSSFVCWLIILVLAPSFKQMSLLEGLMAVWDLHRGDLIP
jgi:hypothetical protein